MLSPCPLSHSCGKMFNAVLNYTINQSSGSRELYCKHSLYVYCICSFNTVSLFCVLLTSLIFSLSQHHLSSFLCINIICANQMWYLFLIVWISHTESAAPVRPILFMIYRIFILLSSSYSCDHPVVSPAKEIIHILKQVTIHCFGTLPIRPDQNG